MKMAPAQNKIPLVSRGVGAPELLYLMPTFLKTPIFEILLILR